MRRVPFVIAILAGATLLVVPLAKSELKGSRAGDKLVEQSFPQLTKPALRELRSDLDQLKGVAAALIDTGVPRLATLSGQSPDAFRASLVTSDPAVSKGLEQVPGIVQQADKVVSNLERRRGQFESAASLPGPGLSLKEGVWAGLAVGAALALAGAVGMARPRRWLVAAITVVGILLVAAPLALRYPAKTADTDAILDSLRPYSAAKVHARQVSLATVRGMLDGFQNDVVPKVAATARTTPAAVAADLAAADERLSPTHQAETEAHLKRFASVIDFSVRIQPLLVDSTRLPARALTWLLIVPGAALVFAGAIGLRG